MPGPPDSLALLLVPAAYLLGAVPVGYLVGRWARGIDIREYGTGNPGASNVWRNVGPGAGAAVALLCVLQGLGPVLVAQALGCAPLAAGLVGLAAVVGYCWPVYAGFRGGRAVAVSFGALAGLWPGPAAALVACFGTGLLLDRYALSMLLGFGALPVYLGLTGESPALVALAAAIYALLLLRRLSGLRADLRAGHRPGVLLRQRLLHDRRPGQRLVGRRSAGAELEAARSAPGDRPPRVAPPSTGES